MRGHCQTPQKHHSRAGYLYCTCKRFIPSVSLLEQLKSNSRLHFFFFKLCLLSWEGNKNPCGYMTHREGARFSLKISSTCPLFHWTFTELQGLYTRNYFVFQWFSKKESQLHQKRGQDDSPSPIHSTLNPEAVTVFLLTLRYNQGEMRGSPSPGIQIPWSSNMRKLASLPSAALHCNIWQHSISKRCTYRYIRTVPPITRRNLLMLE